MRDLFGPDGYYLELMDHGLEEQRAVAQGIFRLHRETDIPLVVTNDAHYLTKQDAGMQDVLICVQTNHNVDDPKPDEDGRGGVLHQIRGGNGEALPGIS